MGYLGIFLLFNKEVVVLGIKLVKVLNMIIDSELYFDRKNYFYFDLFKGY